MVRFLKKLHFQVRRILEGTFIRVRHIFSSECQWCCTYTTQKMKFSIKDPADLVTITEEILNGKLHFLCSVI